MNPAVTMGFGEVGIAMPTPATATKPTPARMFGTPKALPRSEPRQPQPARVWRRRPATPSDAKITPAKDRVSAARAGFAGTK